MTKSSSGIRYGIIVNPSAGRTSLKAKRMAIAECARILGRDTLVAGWDTDSPETLRKCAVGMAGEVDVLVVAGGDGTISDIINTTGSDTVLAYLPMGSGNAWRNTLGLPRPEKEAARQIKEGRVRTIDLVLVDERRKGLLASVGFEGHALSEREKFLNQGVTGFDAYFRATAKSFFGGYRKEDATVNTENGTVHVRSAMTLIVTKTPFYGYGLKMVPKAKLDDGLLHVLLVSGHPASILSGIVTAISDGNLFGEYTTCKEATIRTDKDLHLQVDGTLLRKGRNFTFRVLPAALKVRY